METKKKEEAMRAKEMALEKMATKDFKKAQKIALKAQKLCEDLDDIDQIIMICDVLCSVGSEDDEKNWYKILNVDPTVDEASIKRQYSKMALKLHPDRNSFPGAAEAFNLVLEAKTILANNERRRMYDSRCNAKASWSAESTQCMAKKTTRTRAKEGNKKGRKRMAKNLSCGIQPQHDSKNVECLDGEFNDFEQGRKKQLNSKNLGCLNGEFNDFEQGRNKQPNSKNHECLNGKFNDFEQGRNKQPNSKNLECLNGKFNGFEQGRNKQPNSKNLECLIGEFNDFEQEIISSRQFDHKKSEKRCGIEPDSKNLEYLDGEFNDFEQGRMKECFSRGQIWAVYDTLDAMPRFYAVINDVVSRDFEVEITWLEPLQRNVFEDRWLLRGLPASFGKFILGQRETIRDHGIFSHLVTTWKTSSESSNVYDIFPSKGEIWALFKKWGTKSFMNEKARHEYEFEFVEILSDYYDGFGVNVAFLSKMDGLSSSFCRKSGKGVDWEVIPSKHRLRFSHKIPTFRVQNGEKNFFELDAASLPLNLC